MTGLATASFLAFGALLVLFGANSTEIIATLGLDYADLGLLGSMLSLGLGIGIVSAGPLVDRFSRRPLYVAACGLVCASTATLGPGISFPTFLVVTFAIGLGAGFYETVLNTLIIEIFEARAPRRLIFIHSAATLAASLTPLAIEGLRGAFEIQWQESFQIVGGVHLGLIVATFFVPMPSRRSALVYEAASPRRSEKVASVGRDRIQLAAICLTTFAYVGVESALTLFVADHAANDLGLDSARASRTISAFWGGLLIGRLVVGFTPRAPGAGTTALLASVAAGVVLAFGLGWTGGPEPAMAIVGFFLGGVFPVMIGLAGLTLPGAAGTAVGLAGGLGSLGGFVIPWLTGRVAIASNLSVAIAGLSGWLILLVAGATTVFIRQRSEKGLSSARG